MIPALQGVNDLVAFGQNGIRPVKSRPVLALHQIPSIPFHRAVIPDANIGIGALQIGNINAAIPGAVADDEIVIIAGYIQPLSYELGSKPPALVQRRQACILDIRQPLRAELFVGRLVRRHNFLLSP